MTDRRRYQHEVNRLLEAIADRVAELEALRVRGVRGLGLADREGELQKMRRKLATLVSQTADRSTRSQHRLAA
jgi:hypothetical protein